jgi:aminopeptidase N
MRALPLVLLVACGGGDADVPPDATPPTGPMTVAVDQYELSFDVDSRYARATVQARVTTGGDCVTLPFRGELVGGVDLDGVAATVNASDTALTACGRGWFDGAELTMTVNARIRLQTWGGSQVGYSISPTANDQRFYYMVSWIGGCDRFAPCDVSPDTFAHYRFTVTHPEDVTVLCPGTIAAGATTTTCDFTFDGGPTYSTFGVVASADWAPPDERTWSNLAVSIYNRNGSTVAAAIDDAWITGFVDTMQLLFGEYPYGDALRIVTGPTYWSGFEHPGNIVLDDDLDSPLSSYADPVNHVLAHELAHQWAGDETTLAGTYDFVWKEAMAEYLSFLYEDMTRPDVAKTTALAWKSFANGADYYPVPEEEPPLLDYYGHVYGPGPMILFRQLEALFSRDDVLTALTMLLGSERAIGVDDVQAALEAATGADLAAYFDRWVRGTGAPVWPQFSIATADAGGGMLDVTVTQTNAASGLAGCAFAVQLRGAAAEDTVDVWFDLGVDGSESATQRVATPAFAITSTALDPHGHCLAYPATAAQAPRRPAGWTPWRSGALR